MGHDLSREAIAARELLEAVRAGDEILIEDEQLVLASETNLLEALAEAVGDLAELEALDEALESVMKRQATRRARFRARQESIREAIRRAFETASLASPIVLPEATLSLGKGRRKVTIINLAEIPPAYLRYPPAEANKEAISKDLSDGREVPGASLGNAEPVLTIRRT